MSQFQWVGVIPEESSSSAFGVSTDLLPTFLEAAGLIRTPSVSFDGISLLGELIGQNSVSGSATTSAYNQSHSVLKNAEHIIAKYKKKSFDRVAMWYKDFEEPKHSAIWLHNFKLILDPADNPVGMFDMILDGHERKNLITERVFAQHKGYIEVEHYDLLQRFMAQPSNSSTRMDYRVHQLILHSAYQTIHAFSNHGSDALKLYLLINPMRNYPMSHGSDTRSFNKLERTDLSPGAVAWKPVIRNVWDEAEERRARKALINYQCVTLCSCKIPATREVPVLPYGKVDKAYRSVRPNTQIASRLLSGHLVKSDSQSQNSSVTMYTMPDSGIKIAVLESEEVRPEDRAVLVEKCTDMKLKFNVQVGFSWGTLPESMRIVWKKMDCDSNIV